MKLLNGWPTPGREYREYREPFPFQAVVEREMVDPSVIGTNDVPPSGTRGLDIVLFLAAKAAEGAAGKTLEWYGMILRRAVRDLGEDRPIEQVAGPSPDRFERWLAATLRQQLLGGHERRAPDGSYGPADRRRTKRREIGVALTVGR